MEITKIRMQMQALLPAAERQTTMEVVRGLGLKGMYSGSLATLSRDVPFSVLFFPGYANIRKLLADERGENSMTSTLLSGGLAGAFASGAVTPSDVIKTRYTSISTTLINVETIGDENMSAALTDCRWQAGGRST